MNCWKHSRAVQIIKLHAFVFFVIPAQAGIQWHSVDDCMSHWTPAYAGVTEGGD